jgi:hypothetical protein
MLRLQSRKLPRSRRDVVDVRDNCSFKLLFRVVLDQIEIALGRDELAHTRPRKTIGVPSVGNQKPRLTGYAPHVTDADGKNPLHVACLESADLKECGFIPAGRILQKQHE